MIKWGSSCRAYRGWGHGSFNKEVGEDLSEETAPEQGPEPWEFPGYLEISEGRGSVSGRWLSRGRGPKVRINVELPVPRGGCRDCISWMEGKGQRAACPHYPPLPRSQVRTQILSCEFSAVYEKSWLLFCQGLEAAALGMRLSGSMSRRRTVLPTLSAPTT